MTLPLLIVLFLSLPAGGEKNGVTIDPVAARDLLVRLLSEDEAARSTARVAITRSRDLSLLPALVDALFFASPAARGDIVRSLESLSGESLGANHRYWVEYVGGREQIRPKDGYRAWKAALFARIDPAFSRFLDPSAPLTIRAEEIVWGGVRKDGIPALKTPKSVPAREVRFLDDGEGVFGIERNGEARAYPQRILDWHEMANDVVGGEALVLSYCTLCGSAISYATRMGDGKVLLFGSSGLLYRSNKLMYDEATLSLWSNLTGEPVAGSFAGRGIRLAPIPMTTTTWREWRRRHPATTVVSPDTGYDRDYSPGAAYGRYFASPETMFPVWRKNPALATKAWVYGLRAGGRAKAYPLDLLFGERVVNDEVGGVAVVLVADRESGAVRAYSGGDQVFSEGPHRDELVEPSTAAVWKVEESGLRPVAGGPSRQRLAGHRAYWFGWYAFFPDTELYEGCAAGPPGGR